MSLPDHPGLPDETIYLLDIYSCVFQDALKANNPADFVDLRFLRKLEEEGFFKKFSIH
jgi:hypothetical protein